MWRMGKCEVCAAGSGQARSAAAAPVGPFVDRLLPASWLGKKGNENTPVRARGVASGEPSRHPVALSGIDGFTQKQKGTK